MIPPLYEPGAVRWRKHDGNGDVRAHRIPGWDIEAHLIDTHPISGKPLLGSQWWFKETKEDYDR